MLGGDVLGADAGASDGFGTWPQDGSPCVAACWADSSTITVTCAGASSVDGSDSTSTTWSPSLCRAFSRAA